MLYEDIKEKFESIMGDCEGICGFISNQSSNYLKRRLINIENVPITKVQFDQLLSLQNIKCISDGFFKYYWLSKPKHFYKLQDIELDEDSNSINSIEQLYWGFNRLFIDCLYVYGNIQKGFELLSDLTYDDLVHAFEKHTVNTKQIKSRGNTLHFNTINEQDRYLISEMACKTFANINSDVGLREMLISSYREAAKKGIRVLKCRALLDGTYSNITQEEQQMSMFTATDIIDEEVKSEKEIADLADKLYSRFTKAHSQALENTNLYLSLVNDLDVYVATSMRTKKHFMEMAHFCDEVFKSDDLKQFDLRYFDPTISAADSHEDKGLIECLMVKSARLLIYSTGEKDSYGKDVEAAMALCLGKPVIFYCKENGRANFFRDVHPLSRLVDFKTGVAGGVIVCETEYEVITIIKRFFTNSMQYQIEKKARDRNYYLLKEAMTGSVVRIQTDNNMLSSVFWNSYNR